MQNNFCIPWKSIRSTACSLCSYPGAAWTTHASSFRCKSLKATLPLQSFTISSHTEWSLSRVVSMMICRTIKSDMAAAGPSANYPQANREQNIAYWFGLVYCVVDGEQTNTNKMNQLDAGCGPQWVTWSKFLIYFIITQSQRNKSATVFCWRRQLPQAILKNAFFLFLDLNQPMLANVFLWIQIPLCCNAHGKAVVTCLDAAADHL